MNVQPYCFKNHSNLYLNFCARSANKVSREDFCNAPVKGNETPKEDDTDTEIANDFIFL